MGTKRVDISGIPFTSTPSFAYNNKWNELSSTFKFGSLTPSQSVSPYLDHPSFSLAPKSFTHSDLGGNRHMIPIDCTLGQDTRRLSVLLDTPSPSSLSPRATSESQFPLMDMGLGVPDTFGDWHILAPNVAPKPQVVPCTLPVLGLSSGSFSSMRHHQANIDLDHSIFPTANALASSFDSAKDVTNFINNERQPPGLVMIYRAPEKKGSGHRRSRRACAINIEGSWVDKDDLYSSAGHDSGTISVYECRWATSSNPCEMWIIGSRSRVGAHIRRWHTRQKHANSRADCLWDGCTKAMLKDSIDRHIVTVHLGESFHCLSCNQEFPRKDVYNQHVEDSEACRDAGAVMVYGAEPRVIDTHQALHGGAAIRYASR